jgi:hypothetical protein
MLSARGKSVYRILIRPGNQFQPDKCFLKYFERFPNLNWPAQGWDQRN